jgi:hypothetical protein
MQISVFCTIIGKKVAKGAICGIFSTGGLGRIGRSDMEIEAGLSF